MARETTNVAPKKRRKPKARPGGPWWRRVFVGWRRLAVVAALLLVVGAVIFALPYWRLARQLEHPDAYQPSRLYGRADSLIVGERFSPDRARAELLELGYREVIALEGPGQFRVSETSDGSTRMHLFRREILTPQGVAPAVRTATTWPAGRDRIAAVEIGGAAADSLQLDPPLIRSWVGPTRRDRWLTTTTALPAYLVRAVLAAEDDRFYHHSGLSIRGMLRALVVNLREGEVEQGGSTLTQQLVKNLFLTQERTVVRKLQEVFLAVLVELRYEKEHILETYLNEIFWGRNRGLNVMGVGSAARVYFGRPPEELDLAESAALAGMISSPGRYSPFASSEAFLERRNWVLARMVELGWIRPGEAEDARRVELEFAEAPPTWLDVRHARFASDAVAAEVASRSDVDELEDEGYFVLSTLDPHDQEVAEETVRQVLEELDPTSEGDEARLQGLLLAAHPPTGGIRAYVGGRDYARSQFDRVRLARRQVGSAFKPIVLASALEHRVTTPVAVLRDSPIEVQLAGQKWRPKNDDRRFRGDVTVRRAVEQSLNVPMVRLALQVGLSRVVATARALGIESRLDEVPSLALGAFEMSALELATAYATLADNGLRRELHFVDAVLDRNGDPVGDFERADPVRSLSAPAAYQVTSILEGVVNSGTGRRARQLGVRGAVAGKSGTSSRARDSWFAGYSSEEVVLAWVGYDSGEETALSGSKGALPIWARYLAQSTSASGRQAVFAQPRGLQSVTVDLDSGGRALPGCDRVGVEFLRSGSELPRLCPVHGLPKRGFGFGRKRAQRAEQREAPAPGQVPAPSTGETEVAQQPTIVEQEPVAEPVRRKRGFFRRIFGRRGGADEREEPPE